MRVVFMGTPDFAVPVLAELIAAGYNVVAAVSQPDREKDKKGNVIPTPVKKYATEHGINCLQSNKISLQVDDLRALKPDVMITAAFGQLLSEKVLKVAPLGVLNVHASLLPKYRGSSPIQTAILCGEKQTGVTIMKTDIGMDTGDVVAIRSLEIQPNDTSLTLTNKLSELGAKLLAEVLPKYASGEIVPVKQNHELASGCKKIVKQDGVINWNLSATEINNKIRAYNPWPTAFTYLNGEMLKIYSADVDNVGGTPGAVTADGNKMRVACGSGSLLLGSVQLPGKKIMPVADFLRGHKIFPDTVLTNG